MQYFLESDIYHRREQEYQITYFKSASKDNFSQFFKVRMFWCSATIKLDIQFFPSLKYIRYYINFIVAEHQNILTLKN